MKRGSPSCVIREIQIKTIMTSHSTTSTRMVEIQNTETPNAGENGVPQGSQPSPEGMQNGAPNLEDSLVVS